MTSKGSTDPIPTEPGGPATPTWPAPAVPSDAGGAGVEPNELAETFGELARTLRADHDLDRTLAEIVAVARDTVPGTEECSVFLLENGTARSVAPTSELAERVDQLQFATQQGPCLAAIDGRNEYRIADLAVDPRWPEFASAAVELGVHSMLAFKLASDARTLGALNLYSWQRDAFTAEDEYVGGLLATHASFAVSASLRQRHLRTALERRDVISTAKGLLMARHRCTDTQAFDMLIRASQHTHRKLYELAVALVEHANQEADDPGVSPAPESGR